ncbi:hypothetical protein GCM10023185_05390 [Hymenobacter saemangeumensis]|uniref:VWA domain-containing protein n=1 Tax=Hymenobacter saemangeumensis TaxID=1084522 RepID=A0ABP8I181_9BACT
MKHFLLLLLLGLAYAGVAQPGAAPELEAFYDKLNAYPVPRYRPTAGYQRLTLPSNFSNEQLAALQVADKQLVRVDLVYTAYRLDPKFNQRQLNLGRIRNLAAKLPGVLENEAITWNLVEQTGCSSPEQCQDFFHGFVLYFEKRYTATDSRREADSLKRILEARTKKIDKLRAARTTRGRPIPCEYPRSHYKLRQVARRIRRGYDCEQKQAQTVEFRADVDRRGRIQRVELGAGDDLACRQELARTLRESFSFTNGFRVGNMRFPFSITGRLQLPARRNSLVVTGYFLSDSLVRRHRIRMGREACFARMLKPGEPLDEDPLPNPDADVVSKVMSRHPEWNKRVVVADVTGSMLPYTLDLLTWLQLSTMQEEKTFVFFNDGNDASDKHKPIGSTGGLYDIKTADFAQVKAKVLEAMLAGGGGDAPENDGEAIAHALELVPDATEVILLADNHTFPRDARLLKNVKAKVRIILCGAGSLVNPRYLSLARKHGFSLHTLESDLLNLSAVLEGETITIQGAQYLLTKDGFKLIKTL